MPNLTTAQLQALKASIQADPILGPLPNTVDNNIHIAEEYNKPASPTFTVWKSSVSIYEVWNAINGVELDGLTTGNKTTLNVIAAFAVSGLDPTKADKRTLFDNIFSGAGGTQTRGNLAILWRRQASRVERLYATGTGSDPSPGLLVFEGTITWQDVNTALNL